MTVVIRKASAADAHAIAALLAELGYPIKQIEVSDRFAQFGERLNVCVALSGEDVAGVIAYSDPIPRLAEGGTFVRITALSVAEDYRRSGIAKALIAHVERLVKQNGVQIIEVSSGRRSERDAAHSFYPSMGYQDTADQSVVYRKTLRSSPGATS